MKNLVTVDWLKENMDNENLIIFDVRNVLGDDSFGKEEYKKDHIPNAIHVPAEEILTGELEEHGGRHPLPDMHQFADRMKEFGVDDESTVILYDDSDLQMAGRLWWMLKYIGFKKIYLVFGGYSAWKARNYPITTDLPKIKESKELNVSLQEDMIADIEEAKKASSDKSQVLVDSRTADRYRGEVEPIDRVPGHIPGAINIPWTDIIFYDHIDETIIKEHFKSLEDYDKVVVHCGSGITATVNLIFMDEIGLKPALYVGGYSDWISYPENEIAREI